MLHRARRQTDYSVFLEVQSVACKVVLRGVRKDVEAAAEKIREISHEFRHMEERWPVAPYQVCPSVRRIPRGDRQTGETWL